MLPTMTLVDANATAHRGQGTTEAAAGAAVADMATGATADRAGEAMAAMPQA